MQVDNRLKCYGENLWQLYIFEIDCLFYLEWKLRHENRPIS